MNERNRVRFTNFLHAQTDMCFDWLRAWIRDHPNTVAYSEDPNGRVVLKYDRAWIVNSIGENAIAMYECGFARGDMEPCDHIDACIGMVSWVVTAHYHGCRHACKRKRDDSDDELTLERTEDDNTYMGFVKEKDYNEWLASMP